MEISYRLKMISEFVDDGSVIADIGTDHGYIPIYLAKQGRIRYALACDVNRGPLEKAKENIRCYGVGDFVETRLSDGLDGIDVNEVDTVIIAGMGGILIERILENGRDVVKTVDKLILSPHSDVELVRRKIHGLDYKIVDEKLIKDEGKYYNIISAIKGKEKKYDTVGYKYGKILIDRQCTLLKEKLLSKEKKFTELALILHKQGTDNAKVREEEVTKEVNEIREVLKCL